MRKRVRVAALWAVLCAGWIPLHAWAQLGSLVVTMSAPASGSTVSGTTTVSASVVSAGGPLGVSIVIDAFDATP